MYEASWLAKNKTRSDISLTEPSLLRGISFINLSLASSSKYAVMSVSIKPGATEFTVIPLEPTSLARALVKDSDLILLDEPLANLDFKLREELREELPKLFENRDCIVVYATTEPSEALLLGGNTATLQEGKIIQYGKTLGK